MKTGKRFRESLIVTSEATEPVEPAKAALDHPPPGQHYKTLFFLEFDHLQFDAFVECSLRWLFARVSLICKCNFDCVSRHVLDLTCQFCYLGTLLFVGRCHMYRQQLPQGVHRNVDLAVATLYPGMLIV